MTRADPETIFNQVVAINSTLEGLSDTGAQMVRTSMREEVSRAGPVWFFYDALPRAGIREPMTEFNWARGYTVNAVQLLVRQLMTGLPGTGAARTLEELANLWNIQRAFPTTLADSTTSLEFHVRGLHREPSYRPR
ncbi:hypothetical protein MYU51_004373 [Penicillium brevicompactum]|uniref:uncharacterized protein n=1 Tax=Penicillium brevicompactum TaxID=5074 RepID=UPI002541865E|nr:uncharacterized protein N7506_000497 [Penicillium brevicompactum]KAJ5347244.1 hypothetical protein N7506_000497 [Penicillium brevicompactum]